jgi:hypothetical protein
MTARRILGWQLGVQLVGVAIAYWNVVIALALVGAMQVVALRWALRWGDGRRRKSPTRRLNPAPPPRSTSGSSPPVPLSPCPHPLSPSPCRERGDLRAGSSRLSEGARLPMARWRDSSR